MRKGCVRLMLAAAAGLLPLAAAMAAQPGGDDLTRALGDHRWTLDEATDANQARISAVFPVPDHRMTFLFTDGRVSVAGGCNRLLGSYRLTGGELTIGQLAGTLMACEPALMQADAAMTQLLAKPLTVGLTPGVQPLLRLTSAAGDVLVLAGTATPESRYGPGRTMFLEVAPQMAPCQRPPMPAATCLRVRELHFDKSGLRVGRPGPWRPLYENIEGYTHEAGVRNVLRVKRYKRNHPPADASSSVYVLDLVVESELVTR